MSRRWKVGLALLAVALAAGAVVFIIWATRTRTASLPPLPVSTVPASWREFRLGRGHVVHVNDERLPCTKCHTAAGSFSAPNMRVCAECHAQKADMKHGLHGDRLELLVGMADCTNCHAFGPKEHGGEPWACISCHELPQGGLHAVSVHADQACEQCHRPRSRRWIAWLVTPRPTTRTRPSSRVERRIA